MPFTLSRSTLPNNHRTMTSTDTVPPAEPIDHIQQLASHSPSSKQSSRMKHFCLPISTRVSSHHGTHSISNKLKKKNGRPSVDITTHTNTARASNATLVPPKAHQPQRYSIQRVPRQKPDGDTVWLQYPAQLEPYNGFEYDEDLNNPDGDCLIYFEQADQTKVSTPTFQIHSDKVQGANIAFLNDLLRSGRRHRAQESTVEAFPRSDRLISARRDLRRHSFLPLMRNFSPLKFPQFDPMNRSPAKQKRISWNPAQIAPRYSLQKDQVDESDSDEEDCDFSIAKFEIVFATREGTKHIYELAIRNLFAILERVPIVGKDLIQTLGDVQDLLDAFDVSPAGKNIDTTPTDARLITSYVEEMKLDDVRYDLEGALMMLAWTESPSVRWSPGYFETFIHVVGLMTPETKDSTTFKLLSTLTRNNLRGAHEALELVKVMSEEKLQDFAFTEMWSLRDDAGKENLTPIDLLHLEKQADAVRKAAEAFKDFVVTYYRQLFGAWPPCQQGSSHWLSRAVVKRLQADFGLLYEYLVDKDVVWDNLVAAGRRDWEMFSRRDDDFRADEHAAVTDMLVSFDDANDFSHIPHPFPLLPVSERKAKRKSIFGSLMGSKTAETSARREALSIASNKDLDREGSDFLAAFQQHEAGFSMADVSTIEARLGRWVQLYAVLQSLSFLAVDVPGLRYTADVDYFLCFGLNGHPPWTTSPTARSTVVMPSQEASYCWSAAARWEEERSESISECEVTQRRRRPSITPPDSGVSTSGIKPDQQFVMPDGSLVPAPDAVLRQSRPRLGYSPSPSQASISALPRIPEKSEKRRLSFAPSAISTTTNDSTAGVNNITLRSPQRRRAARFSITPSLQSEPDEQEEVLRKKRETILSMDGTEWADTEFSGEDGGIEGDGAEAKAVEVKRGVKGKLVERAMSSTGSVVHFA